MSETANIFEVATRGKYRFPYKGQITVEDLWDLSVTQLDSIFKTLNAQYKQSKEESLLETKSKEDEVLDTQIAIVKHIVAVKQQEAANRLAEKERRTRRSKASLWKICRRCWTSWDNFRQENFNFIRRIFK